MNRKKARKMAQMVAPSVEAIAEARRLAVKAGAALDEANNRNARLQAAVDAAERALAAVVVRMGGTVELTAEERIRAPRVLGSFGKAGLMTLTAKAADAPADPRPSPADFDPGPSPMGRDEVLRPSVRKTDAPPEVTGRKSLCRTCSRDDCADRDDEGTMIDCSAYEVGNDSEERAIIEQCDTCLTKYGPGCRVASGTLLPNPVLRPNCQAFAELEAQPKAEPGPVLTTGARDPAVEAPKAKRVQKSGAQKRKEAAARKAAQEEAR